jgi:hypothetical protein
LTAGGSAEQDARLVRRLAVVFAACSSIVLSTAARADDDPMAACIASSDKGLDLRKQGKLLEARSVLTACAAPSCGPAISAVCGRRIADINGAIPSVIFLPRDGSGHDLVSVTMGIDGAAERVPLDGRPVAIDPGPHTFRFEAPGQPPVERSFVVAEGTKNRQEAIDMIPPPPAPSAPPSAVVLPAPPPATHAEGGSRTGAWVTGTIGVVGIVAGSVLGALAISEASTSRTDCESSSSCLQHGEAVTAHNTAATEATGSTIAFAAGGVALAVATYLFLVPSGSGGSGQASPRSRVGVELEPSVSPQAAGLTLHGTF